MVKYSIHDGVYEGFDILGFAVKAGRGGKDDGASFLELGHGAERDQRERGLAGHENERPPLLEGNCACAMDEVCTGPA